MDEQKILITTINITKLIINNEIFLTELNELITLCNGNTEYIISRLLQILDNLNNQQKIILLLEVKDLYSFMYLKYIELLIFEKNIDKIKECINDYKNKFGEDKYILFVELNILFMDGFTNNENRINNILAILK